jgi:beta-galactosidase
MKKIWYSICLAVASHVGLQAQNFSPKTPYYGVAYYDEYMPYDRLQQDVEMMKKAGINVVRIAESTWSTLEPKKIPLTFRILIEFWMPCTKLESL